MPTNNADENFKRKLILDISAGIYKLVLKDTDNLEIWKTFAMIQKGDGSMVDHYYACIHCKKVCKAAGTGASNMYLHITKCPMQKNAKSSVESGPKETKTEIHYKLKTGVYKMVLKESNNIAIWEKYAMVSNADGSILDGYYCCIKCLKVFRVYNIYLSSLYRHVKSCAKNVIKLQQNPQQEMENDIKRKIRNNLQKRTKTKSNTKIGNEDEPIQHGTHELEDGTDTASDDELLEEKKSNRMPINPIWQTFDLSLTDECKEVLSCRKCKMVLDSDYSSKSRVEVHKCPSANKRNSKNRLIELPSQRDVEEKIKSEISNKVKAGIFKLAKNHTNKRLVWKVFDLIRSTNGRIVENYACCSICENILKSSFAKPTLLSNHNCYIQFVRETKVEVGGYNSNTILEDETTEDIGKEISKNRKSATKSDENDSKAADMDTLTDDSTEDTNSSLPEQMKNVYNEGKSIQNIDKYCSYDDNDPIWLRFKLISLDDGSNSGERVVSCRQCKMILKYIGATKVQLDQHKCFPNAYVDNPKAIRGKEMENTMKNEINDNIRENFPNETLIQTTESDEEYQKPVAVCNDDTDTNEASEMPKVIDIKMETEIREDIITNADDAGTQTEKETFSQNIRNDDKKVEKGNGSAELKIATVTENHASREFEQDNTTTASETNELLEAEKRCSIPANPVWQIFALIFTNEGKPELSCRLCKNVLECDYKSKLYVKEHKCLSADKRNSIKVMPSQRDIEEKIKSEIYNNINAGIFTPTKNKIKRSLTWQVFHLITTTNGTTVVDYTFCSICKKVLKCHLMKIEGLRPHRCYQQFLRLRKDEQEGNSSLASSKEQNEKDVENKLKSGIYTMDNSKATTNPIWTQFSLISKSDGTLIKEMVCCRLCKVVLKCNGQNSEECMQQHKCLLVEESSGNKKNTSKLAEKELRTEMDKRKSEIKSNITAGVYTLHMNPDGKSLAWKMFARIKAADDTLIEDYVFCTKCKHISTYDGHRTGNLTRHPCLNKSSLRRKPSALKNDVKLEWETPNKRPTTNVSEEENDCRIKTTSTEKMEESSRTNYRKFTTKSVEMDKRKLEIKSKISAGIFTLLMNPDGKGLACTIFARIIDADGTLVEDYVVCTKCKQISSYNAHRTTNLTRHPCLNKSRLWNEASALNTETTNKRPKASGVRKEENKCRTKRIKIEEQPDFTINSSFYERIEISNEAENIQNNDEYLLHAPANDPLWLRFEVFTMDDGSTVDRVVSCRQCKMILKYEGTSKFQLEQHKCFSTTSLPTNAKTIEKENNEIENCYSVCVKEEYMLD